MVKQKQSERKTHKNVVSKIPKFPKQNKRTPKSSSSLSSEESIPLSNETIERLNSLINIEEIERNGFTKDFWLSLSFEDKCNLPLFISSKFRKSSSREERKNNEKQKRNLNGIVLKYQKYSMRRFYLTNKKKIKEMRKNDNKLSGNQATEILWNELSNDEKENWYQSSLSNQDFENKNIEQDDHNNNDEEEVDEEEDSN